MMTISKTNIIFCVLVVFHQSYVNSRKKSLKKLQHYEKYAEFFQEIQRKIIENDTPSLNNQTKIILFWKKSLTDGIMDGSGYLPFESCLQKNCYITRNISLLDDPNYGVHGIIFMGGQQNLDDLEKIKNFKQSDELLKKINKGIEPRLILFMMESPHSVDGVGNFSHQIYQETFDLTMTYRHDSEITLNYGHFVNKTTNEIIKPNSFINYEKKKQLIYHLSKYGLNELDDRTKDIAWIVSHCDTISKREHYVKEMQKYHGLKIDTFGKCAGDNAGGLSEIPDRKIGWVNAYEKLAPDYKFYLSFENSRCLDYITEKFFTALEFGMIPVVLGGLSKRDYEKIAPPHSFLHVDDFKSPGHLMKELHLIAKDSKLFNSYFWWQDYYRVQVNILCCPSHEWTYPACQLCDILNSNNTNTKNNYDNLNAFWHKCR